MKKCMGTDKPLVTIVMATYNPRLEWFIKQLKSLNAQDYDNLELIVLDDCSPNITIDELGKLLEDNITEFPYRIFKNNRNLGSTKSFEKLTEIAGGKYISYCDQDDIWESVKINSSVEAIEKTGAALVCCDVRVIDGSDNLTAESITEIRKRQVFKSGEDLSDTLMFRNFVIGCTILMETKMAKQAIPFVDGMVHDHWLALFASTKGRIEVCDEKLMRYRIHGENQTSVLSGIKTKKDYYNKRIEPYLKQAEEISHRIQINSMPQILEWANARVDFYNGKLSAFRTVLKYRKFNINVSYFELAIKIMPELIYKQALRLLQR